MLYLSFRKSAFAWHGSCARTADVFYWCKRIISTFHRSCLLTNLAKWVFGIASFYLFYFFIFIFWHFAKLECKEREEIIPSWFWKSKKQTCKESAVRYSAVLGGCALIKCYKLETSRFMATKITASNFYFCIFHENNEKLLKHMNSQSCP